MGDIPNIYYHKWCNIDTPKEERRKANIGDIFINGCKCLKCGKTIYSTDRHDFKWCQCQSIAVDGGSWYCKRVGNLELMEECSVVFSDVDANN